ncbi:hypothetical protein [Luteimonas mephitis]|uniref:hypothetical protein n=1 Tax=Luteimonas mephitis TaxID=83615 RepID=UPI00047E59E2|nr:hypothetical protein [Luteimonas mephitis]
MATGKRSADPSVDLERIRTAIAAEKEWLSLHANLRAPRDEALQRADDYVDDLAERCILDGSEFSELSSRLPKLEDVDDILYLIAWLNPDTMKANLRTVVGAFYDELGASVGFDTPETHAAVAKRKAKLFDLECEEERAIRAAEQTGVRLPRRPDADTRAVLSVD